MQIFDGLKVVDAASYLAGPGAATVLGDYGADVIKIEPLAGDGYRNLHGRHPVDYNWMLTSRNKRSLALDFSSSAGQGVLKSLIRDADVFLTNFRGNQLDKFSLGYDTLRAENPRLVYAQMTGYGNKGVEADRRGFDSTAWWARTGMMDLVRDPGQAPIMGVPGFGDHASAMTLFGAIMMGLYKRERTGEGSFVATSLVANGVWANGMQLQAVLAGFDMGERRQAKGWLNPFASVYGSSDDRYVLLAIMNPTREWPALARALGHEEWLSDPRFAEMSALMKNRRALIDAMQLVTRRLTLADLTAALDAHDITYAVVNQLSEVVADPHLIDTGVMMPTGQDEEGWDWTVNNPIEMHGEQTRQPNKAPNVGEHSEQILAEHGYDGEAIGALRRDGVIG